MYKIYADDTLIYDSTVESYKITKGEVTLEIEKAGTFVFGMYPDNPYYDSIVKMKTIITVYKDSTIIFRGRALKFEDDFWKNRIITCEGELAFLLDSIIRPYDFSGTPTALFTKLIKEHNAQVDESKQFSVGQVTVSGSYITQSNTDYEDTWTNINNQLIGNLGGYLFVTHNSSGKAVLNYFKDFPYQANQTIEFGENLKDYMKTASGEDIVTVLIPLGGKVTDDEGNETDEVLTIAGVNGGKDYIENTEAISKYGRIVKTFSWDDVTDAGELYLNGVDKLNELSGQNITIDVTAIDLHLLDRSIESFGYGMYISVISTPHNVDVSMLCTKQTINLLRPDNDSLSLGYTITEFTSSVKANRVNIIKISKDYVNGLLVNYSTTEEMQSEIEQSAETIENNVAETLTEYSTTEEMNSAIEQTEQSITLTVSKTYATQTSVTESINDLNDEITEKLTEYSTTEEMNSAIEQSASSIELSVSKTYATQTSVKTLQNNIYNTLAEYSTTEEMNAAIKLSADSIESEVSTVKTYATTHYGTCSTAASTAAKVVTLSGFELFNGAIVAVKFTYATSVANPTLNVNKTGAYPIYAYNSALTANSSYNWDAQSTVTFIFDGSYWRMADSSSLSKIKQTSESIESCVLKDDFGTYVTQNYSYVRIAWNNYTKYIQFEDAALDIYDSDDALLMKLDNTGNWYYYDGTKTGKIGTNHYTNDDSYRGLSFNLEYDGKYMSWSRKTSSSATFYTMTLTWYRDDSYANAGFNFYDNVYTYSYLHFNTQSGVNSNTDDSMKIWSDVGIYLGGTAEYIVKVEPKSFSIATNVSIDFYSTLNLHGYGYTDSSDARLKTNIAPTNIKGLEVLNSIDLKEYDWIETGNHEAIGLIAQQIQSFAPELIIEDENTGTLQLKADRLVFYCIKAIQELSAKCGLNYNAANYEERYTGEEKLAFTKQAGKKAISENPIAYNPDPIVLPERR